MEQTIYREFEITYHPKPIPCSDHDFDCTHPDYDGADGGNGMYFTASSVEDGKEMIDEYWADIGD